MGQSNEFGTIATWEWAEEGAEERTKLERKACEKSKQSHSKEYAHGFQTVSNGCSLNEKGSVAERRWECSGPISPLGSTPRVLG